jgi:alcohol dehydrogenase
MGFANAQPILQIVFSELQHWLPHGSRAARRRQQKEAHMKAWRLERLGGELSLQDVPTPEPRPGSVLVRIEASALMSYLKPYVEGRLPFYTPPPGPFTVGTNGVGVVEAVGRDVWHLKQGQRVVLSSHFVARENVEDPAQILIGLTAGAGAEPLLADWPDGTLAEYALMPVEAVTPAEGLDTVDAARLAAVSRCVVPYGGLLRGRLSVGETLVVNGATGAYGTAAVLLGAAMGASRVVAAGRNPAALDAVARAGGARVSTVVLTGDVRADADALRAAIGGGAHMAFDMVGNAGDPHSTLAALHSLRRGGRLVLMGSMTTDLPVPYTMLMLNNWEITGQFMYPTDAYRRLLGLLRSGLLDLSPIRPRIYPLAALPEAMEAAGTAGNLEYVVVRP